MWQHFRSLSLPHGQPDPVRQRYSVTADVLAYQECSIQYGAFAVRRYEPALAVQLFYGTIVHQVLDRAHAHFRGELNAPKGSFPTDSDIESYFREVENALRARHIQAVSNVRDQALKVLMRFNKLEGPALYPRIIDTECRLQSDQGEYILHGNVDVLARSESDENDVEIWDYKGKRLPSRSDPEYQRSVFQMQVYADLYKQKTGITPTKSILYFLNELADDPEPTTRPVNALLEVDLNSAEVKRALRSFDQTVQEIETCKANEAWPNPSIAPSEQTCDACDLRWNCSAAKSFGRNYSLIYP